MSAVSEMREYRNRHNLDIKNECNGFMLDDYVKYIKDEKEYSGYILCFRQFGYNWFAWIYPNENDLSFRDCVFVGDLIKIEE